MVERAEDPIPPGSAVVIDVIRAFTTAASAFAAGASSIWCVADPDRGRQLRAMMPAALLMGEDRGRTTSGFDYGNSPRQFDGVDLAGRQVIQCTTNGTPGLLRAKASVVLAAAAINVSATARVAGRHRPVALIPTGTRTSEDRICAELIGRLIDGQAIDRAAERRRILAAGEEHPAVWTRPRSAEERDAHFADVAVCAEIDRFDFAMVGERRDDVVVLTPVAVDR